MDNLSINAVQKALFLSFKISKDHYHEISSRRIIAIVFSFL